MTPIEADRVMWVARRAEVLTAEVRSSSADELREAASVLATERAEIGVSPEFTARVLAVGREALSRGAGAPVSRHAVAAAAAMTEGAVTEVRSGGDVAAATVLAAYWFGLAGTGVHVVTADDRRGREQHASFEPLTELLDVEAGLLLAETDTAHRRRAYAAMVTVGSYAQFAADYLRDNLRDSAGELVQRGLTVAVVVDACDVLVDAAPMISYLSGPPRASRSPWAEAVAVQLRRGEDYHTAGSAPGVTFGVRSAGRLLPRPAAPGDLAAAIDTAQEVETLLLLREGLADGDARPVRADITTQGLLREYQVLAGISSGRPGCAEAVSAMFGLEYRALTGRGPRWSWPRRAAPAPVDLAFERIVDEQRSLIYRDRQQVRDRFDGRLALVSLPRAAVGMWSARGAGEIARGLHDLLVGKGHRTADPEEAEQILRDALAARAATLGDDQMQKLLRRVSLTVLDEQWAAHLGRVRFVQRHGRVLEETLGPPAAVLETLFAWCRQMTVEHTLGYALNVVP